MTRLVCCVTFLNWSMREMANVDFYRKVGVWQHVKLYKYISTTRDIICEMCSRSKNWLLGFGFGVLGSGVLQWLRLEPNLLAPQGERIDAQQRQHPWRSLLRFRIHCGEPRAAGGCEGWGHHRVYSSGGWDRQPSEPHIQGEIKLWRQ